LLVLPKEGVRRSREGVAEDSIFTYSFTHKNYLSHAQWAKQEWYVARGEAGSELHSEVSFIPKLCIKFSINCFAIFNLANLANLAHRANYKICIMSCDFLRRVENGEKLSGQSRKFRRNHLKAKQNRCPKLSHLIVPRLA
jgi:hypothetical protein